jgi:F-type H+-transporting ATPase subunit a
MDSLRNFYERWKQKAQDNPRKTAIWVGIVVLFFLGFLVPVDPPHVALSGEPIFSNGPQWFTNSILTTLIVDLLLIISALFATRNIKMVPGGLQNFYEAVLEYLLGLSESVAGKDAQRYFPWVVTIFLFVIVSNWSGLIPGVGSVGVVHRADHSGDVHSEEPAEHEEQPAEEGDDHGYFWDAQLAMADGNLVLVEPAARESFSPFAAEEEGHDKFVPFFRAPSADLNTTFALALVTMFMVQVWGVKALGASYFKKFFVWHGEGIAMKLLNAFVGALELISEFARIIAFGFRLFGNIFAGEVMLMTMAFLIAFLLPLPFYFLEILVGAVQALVFMMLALVFFSMSTQSHDHDH